MCYKPLKIRNSKFNNGTFDMYNDRYFIQANCGDCGACRQAKHDSWLLRTYIQYHMTRDKGGYTYYETFTYNEDFVPMFAGLRCFRPSDFTNFMKRLRNHLREDGYKVSGNLKYLWVSEYGGDTHRPHYHALFFITIPNLDARTFFTYLKDAWQFGFLDEWLDKKHTQPKDPILKVIPESFADKKGFIQFGDMGAVSYVSKYINKDLDFLKVLNDHRNFEFREWYTARLNHIFCKDFTPDYYFENKVTPFMVRRILKPTEFDFMPFVRVSKGFGSDFLSYFSMDDVEQGFVQFPSSTSPTKYKKISIPHYIDTKLIYNQVVTEERLAIPKVISSTGELKWYHKVYHYVKSDKFKEIFDKRVLATQRFVCEDMANVISSFIVNYNKPKYFGFYKYVSSLDIDLFDSMSSILEFLKKYNNYDEISTYLIYNRDYVVPAEQAVLGDYCRDFSEVDDSLLDIDNIYYYNNNYLLYNSLDDNHIYEIVSQLYDAIRYFDSLDAQRTYEAKQASRSQYKKYTDYIGESY